jgi:hypothetical protein
MDRIEKTKKQREFANRGEVSETDAAALPSVTGRESSNTAPSDIARRVGARPRSEVTGRHDAGSGANETVDGLTSSEEATRRGAENIPIGAPERELEDLPVFDRADALPKV